MTTTPDPNKSATIELGLSGRINLRVVPVTKLEITKARIERRGQQVEFAITGAWHNLPDGQEAELLLIHHYEWTKELGTYRMPVRLKRVNDNSFEVVSSSSAGLLVDPVKFGLLGKATTTVILEPKFPFATGAQFETDFNFPFSIDMAYNGTLSIGTICTFTPKLDPVFDGCVIDFSYLESDDNEAGSETKRTSTGASTDYEVRFSWPAADRAPKEFPLGCGENHALSYANEDELGNFEMVGIAQISRNTEKCIWKTTIRKFPKPKLENFKLTINEGAYVWSHTIDAAKKYFTGESVPRSVWEFSVEGVLSGFSPDLCLLLECTLLTGRDESITDHLDTVQQLVQLKPNGSFSADIAEFLEQDFPDGFDPATDCFFAAIRVASNCLQTFPMVVTRIFSSTRYHPAMAYNGFNTLPDPETWMLSAAAKKDGTKIPERTQLITADELQAIIPAATAIAINTYIMHINNTLNEFGIISKFQIAHFLCHVPVETGSLQYVEQQNTTLRYRGRGIIQLTGEDNYKAFSAFLKRPEVFDNPEIVASDHSLACRSAGWFWRFSTKHDANAMANAEDFMGIVLKINYKANGLSERWEALKRAYRVLKIDKPDERLAAIRAAAKSRDYKLA
jgi:predicted chitinase